MTAPMSTGHAIRSVCRRGLRWCLGPDAGSFDEPHRLGWGSTVALASMLCVLMAWTLPRHVQAGDAGELATVMLRGGVPHPSGYPWMRILGWLFARPLEGLGVPPATAAALPCAAAAVTGWAILHRVALRVAHGVLPGGRAAVVTPTFVVALVASSPVVLVHTADSEVWGPLVLATACVTWLAVMRRPPAFVLGIAIGLATSHHLTAVLLVPLVIGGAWPSVSRFGAVLRAGFFGVAGVFVGLLPYLTLMIGADPGACEAAGGWWWGDTSHWRGLVHHVSRADYGVLSLSLHAEQPPALEQWSRVASSVGSALTAGLVAFAGGASLLLALVVGAAALGRPASVRRAAWAGTIATIVVVVGLFPLAHNIDPTSPFGAWILERFDVMGLVLLTLPVTASIAALVRRADRPLLRRGLALCGILLVLRQSALMVGRGPPAANDIVERYAHDLLRTPRDGRPAIVFGTDDHRLFPVLYVQTVLGFASDVLYVDASLLAHAWYRARLEAQVSCRPELQHLAPLPTEDRPLRMMAQVWDDPAWRDTPIYITHAFSRPAGQLARVPEGVLWRVVPPESQAAEFDAEHVLSRHLAALSRYPAPMPHPERAIADPFAVDLAATYTDTTAQLATALLSEGRTEDARALLRTLSDRTGSGVASAPTVD